MLAEKRPLVLAVDDIHWVDASSASALAFALRRLRSERILLLFARRLDESGEGPALEEALDADAVERLRVGPLSIGAIHALLQRRLGRPFARPTLRRLHEISGGNPFYALELARELGSAGSTVDSLEPFPVPETLERLVGTRLGGLEGATREALLLVAAHGRPSPALLAAAGISPNTLEPAFAAQVVELSTDEIRFTHPLLSSVLYQEASDEERRGAHGRLATVVDDPVERARHLALASDGPDEDVAAILERPQSFAEPRCERRGGRARRVALRLTPLDASEDRDRRTIAAARAHFDAGDPRRARALALELLARPPAGQRAEALVLLSDIEGGSGRFERSIELRREALEAADGQPTLRVGDPPLARRLCSVHGGRGCGRSTRSSGARAGRSSRRRLSARVCALRGRLRSFPGGPSGRALSGRADSSARNVRPRPAPAARHQLHGRELLRLGVRARARPDTARRASTASGASATSLRRHTSSGGRA